MILQRFTRICAADAGRLRPGRRGCACLLLAVLFVCVLMTGVVSAAWNGNVNATWYTNEIVAGHTGSSGNPFLIYDEASLAAFANETNTNTSQDGFSGMHIRLMTDLDLNGHAHNWYPIGNTTSSVTPITQVFKGTFDGGGRNISNMSVSVTTNGYAYAGLFGYVLDATIKNVRLTDVNVTATTTFQGLLRYCRWSGGVCLYYEHHRKLHRTESMGKHER